MWGEDEVGKGKKEALGGSGSHGPQTLALLPILDKRLEACDELAVGPMAICQGETRQ